MADVTGGRMHSQADLEGEMRSLFEFMSVPFSAAAHRDVRQADELNQREDVRWMHALRPAWYTVLFHLQM